LCNYPERIFIGKITEHPFYQYYQAVSETDKTDKMDKHPQKPGKKTGELSEWEFSQGFIPSYRG
jgi:hypothetical protein